VSQEHVPLKYVPLKYIPLPPSTPSSATNTLALARIQAARDKADAALMSVCQHLLHDTVSSLDNADLAPVLGRKWYHTYLVFFRMFFFLSKKMV
jgi:hypothetical protein